jgi:hypothetical protein
MGSTSPSLSASLLSALVGAGAALLVVALVGDREPVARPEPSVPRETALEERLARIESLLEGLRQNSETPSTGDATTAERRSPAGDGASSGAGEIAELRESVEALRRELSASRDAGAIASTSLRDLAQRPGTSSALVDSLAGLGQPGFDRAAAKRWLLDHHMLWTLPQLIEAYGRPDHILAGDNGLNLQYKPSGAGSEFTFLVSEGHVYHAYSTGY